MKRTNFYASLGALNELDGSLVNTAPLDLLSTVLCAHVGTKSKERQG
jgi:hypothetical protein